MIARLVPIAMGMGSLRSSTSTGTIRNPPPTPTSPVASPRPMPCSAMTQSGPCDGSAGVEDESVDEAGSAGRDLNMSVAAVSMSAASRTSCTAPGMNLAA